MTLALSPSIPGPDIVHSGLSAVALDVKTANSIESVRIHSVQSHSVAAVSRPTSTFPRPHLIAAVDKQILQTATTRVVVFELFSMIQEKLMR